MHSLARRACIDVLSLNQKLINLFKAPITLGGFLGRGRFGARVNVSVQTPVALGRWFLLRRGHAVHAPVVITGFGVGRS